MSTHFLDAQEIDDVRKLDTVYVLFKADKNQSKIYSKNNFLSKLGPVVKASTRKKSRRIYPGFDSAYPQVAKNAKVAIEETIRFVEKNIDRNNS
jgi:hypothetical protein